MSEELCSTQAPESCSASPSRQQHLITVLRVSLNRISKTNDTKKIWLEARESLEALRQLEAGILRRRKVNNE